MCILSIGHDHGAHETRSELHEIGKLFSLLPSESAKISVLRELLKKRCQKCLDYDASGQFWCCHESNG